MALNMEDLVALSKYNQKDNTLAGNQDSLVSKGMVTKSGKLTEVGLKTAQAVLATEYRLQKGIDVCDRKKSDIAGARNDQYPWITKDIKAGNKIIKVTVCAPCVYIGSPLPEFAKNEGDPKQFLDVKILAMLHPTGQLQAGTPFKYQIENLSGFKVIWIKLKSESVAIQSCYFDLMCSLFKTAKFFGIDKSQPVYVKVKSNIVATIAHVNNDTELLPL